MFKLFPADIIFTIDEKPHNTFKRQGNELIYEAKISLLQSLTGGTLRLTTLDNRNLEIPFQGVISYVHNYSNIQIMNLFF